MSEFSKTTLSRGRKEYQSTGVLEGESLKSANEAANPWALHLFDDVAK